MTIKELIEKLQDYPEDMEIFTSGSMCTGNKLECTAYKPFPQEKRVVLIDDTYYVAQRACKETSGAKKCLVI